METVSTPARTYKTYRREEKLRLLAECRTCGTTITQFCKERGINRNSYNKWKKKLKDEQAKKPSVFILAATSVVTPVTRSASGIPLRIAKRYPVVRPSLGRFNL